MPKKGEKLPEEQRKRISEILKARYADPNDDLKQNTLNGIAKRWANSENHEKQSEAQKKRFENNLGTFTGLQHSEETKEKNRQAHLGKRFSEEEKAERKQKMIENGTNIPPNKGKKASEEAKRKNSEAHKGKIAYYPNEETKQKISASVKKVWEDPEHRQKVHDALSGEKHPFYRVNGIKPEDVKRDYPLIFRNDMFKEEIRNRDQRKCQWCGKDEEQNKQKLHLHHIDYQKNNLDSYNLISLCKQCHGRTITNRKYWTSIFSKFMELNLNNFDDYHQSYYV